MTQFTGSPLFLDGEEFLPLDSPSLKYVGDPSPEIDSTWGKLIHCKFEMAHSPTWYVLTVWIARYFYITEQEAADAWGDNYRDYWDPKRKGFVAGYVIYIGHLSEPFWTNFTVFRFDLFHTLHCIVRTDPHVWGKPKAYSFFIRIIFGKRSTPKSTKCPMFMGSCTEVITSAIPPEIEEPVLTWTFARSLHRPSPANCHVLFWHDPHPYCILWEPGL